MANEAAITEEVTHTEKKTWYATAYKVIGMSSTLDDCHPDVYKTIYAKVAADLIDSTGPDTVWIQAKSHSVNAY